MTESSAAVPLCGEVKPMTKEHVPPRSAFNKQRWIAGSPWDALNLPPGEVPPGEVRQGESRCLPCARSATTSPGGATRPALQAMGLWRGLLLRADSRGRIHSQRGERFVTVKNTNFLRIMKQIVSMFMSVNPISFRYTEIGKRLARFVLDPTAQGLPEGIKIYMYLNRDGAFRYLPFMVKGECHTGGSPPCRRSPIRPTATSWPTTPNLLTNGYKRSRRLRMPGWDGHVGSQPVPASYPFIHHPRRLSDS